MKRIPEAIHCGGRRLKEQERSLKNVILSTAIFHRTLRAGADRETL